MTRLFVLLPRLFQLSPTSSSLAGVMCFDIPRAFKAGDVLENKVVYTQEGACFDGIALSGDRTAVERKRVWLTDMGAHRADWQGLQQPQNELGSVESSPQADGRVLELAMSWEAGSPKLVPTEKMFLGAGMVVTPKQIVATESFLYWSDREGMRVFRACQKSGAVEVLVQTGLYPQDLCAATRHCVGVWADEAQGWLYWTQKGASNTTTGCLMRAPLVMKAGENPASRTDLEVLLRVLPEPIDLLLVGTHLFWTARGKTEDGGNSLTRATLTLTGLTDKVVLSSQFQAPIGLAVDEEADRIFVSELGGKLWMGRLSTARSEANLTFECIAVPGPMTGLAVLG